MLNNNEVLDIIHKHIGPNTFVVSPLVGGMMNQSFIVENDKKHYVLYISTEQANEMVDRPLEKQHQKIIYDLGITSKNIYFDTDKGIKINEFIEGTSIDKINEFDYQKIATLLRTLHSSPILSSQNYDPFSRFVAYEKEASEFVDSFSKEYLLLKDTFIKNIDYLKKQKLVLSHNDAQRSNIVKDNNNNYYLIDFEFVGNNDEIYDIACFGNGLVEEGRKLLEAYFPNLTIDEEKRYYLWRIYVSLQWFLVATIKHYRGEGKTHGFNFLAVGEHFLNNALTAYKYLEVLKGE